MWRCNTAAKVAVQPKECSIMDDVLPLQEISGNYSETARFSSLKCA